MLSLFWSLSVLALLTCLCFPVYCLWFILTLSRVSWLFHLPIMPPLPKSLQLCSHVLQYTWLPTTWVCREPDRGPSEQCGTLGLRQGIQADWKRHSCVQKDHIWLLCLGCSSSRVSRWAHRLWQLLIFNFQPAPPPIFWSLLQNLYSQQHTGKRIKASVSLSPSNIPM